MFLHDCCQNTLYKPGFIFHRYKYTIVFELLKIKYVACARNSCTYMKDIELLYIFFIGGSFWEIGQIIDGWMPQSPQGVLFEFGTPCGQSDTSYGS